MSKKFLTKFNGQDAIAQLITDDPIGRMTGGVMKAASLFTAGLTMIGMPAPLRLTTLVISAVGYAAGVYAEAESTKTLVQTGRRNLAYQDGFERLDVVTGSKNFRDSVSGFGQRFRRFLSPLRL